MTISSTVRTAGPYTGTGSVTVYPFAFKIFQASDLLVVQTDLAGNLTTLVLTTNYSVTLNADQNANPGGSITLVVALPTNFLLNMSSQVPELQGTSITNNGGFYPKVIETSLDYLTVLTQQLQTSVNSALQIPLGGTSYDVKNNKLINLGTGTNPNDAVNLLQVQGMIVAGAVPQLGTASGASLVGFQQTGTGSVLRTVNAELKRTFHVDQFGADPTGVADSTTAFQNAINAANALGRDVLFSGAYLLLSGLTLNNSSDSTLTGLRASLLGQSGKGSVLNFGPGNYTCIAITGSNTNGGAIAMQKFENFLISKADNLGTCLGLAQMSHVIFTNVRTNGGNLGWNMVDIQESTFINCVATFANGGLVAQPGSFTAPNMLLFQGCSFGNNNQYGADFQNPAAITCVGCSFESNTTNSSSTAVWGCRVIVNNDTALQGTSAATFNGCYFENNGFNGVSSVNSGDLWVVNSTSPTAVALNGCSFQRHSFFVANCIRVDTSGGNKTNISVTGCGFRGYADYTASASRPYILLSSPTDTVRIHAAGNTYQNALEVPNFLNADNFTKDFVASAYVRCNGATAAILGQSANVSSVTRNSAGNYTVNFTDALANAGNFSSCVQLYGAATGFALISADAAGSVTVNTYSNGSVATDFQFSLIVFGGGQKT